ncbi:MAG: M20/M25/M40 family metallo-hydrolase [Salinarimonas sp.]
MDIARLPFDADAMLAGLRPWVECESPTFDAAAVNRMMDLAAADLAGLGARVTRIPGAMGYGDCVLADLDPDRPEPGILILGHLDTVHPVGTLAMLPFRRAGGLCYGPGICDMKGGNFLALEALRVLMGAGIRTPLPVRVLLTSDEEVGSPSTRDLIEATAREAKIVLVPEPGGVGGETTSGRYAIARFEVETIGRPSHAGARLAEGRSAVRAMARRILEIEDMTSADCTFSVGVVHAGIWVNCVPSHARAEVLSMAKRQADLDRGVAALLALSDASGEVETRVCRTVTRPVWEPSEATLALFERARALAATIGVTLTHRSAGGGSDGNFTGALGVPTLDGLGVEGDKFHTLEEHIVVETLASRGRIMAGLLATSG